MVDPNISEYLLNKLNQLGVKINLDDFGTGYSSLSYLNRLPVDGIKIDRSFLMNITKNKSNKVIVESIIILAKQLNLTIIAEGVETKEQLNYLQRLKGRFIQGYYYSHPLSKEEIETKYFKKSKKRI